MALMLKVSIAKQLALERKANKPLAGEVQRHQVTSDLSVHVGILYLSTYIVNDSNFMISLGP
ncbi:hypothetical protein E4U52_008030 [Claviceps spartinae]|nr:hypothetical protein E4U52_008030 [Claviceps spartinae]